jgi:hypothetical protein
MSWFPAEKGASVAAALPFRMIWPLFDSRRDTEVFEKWRRN